MSELTPKEPKTPEEKRARAHKIRTMVLDMFLPVLAAARLALMGLIAAGALERGALPFPYL